MDAIGLPRPKTTAEQYFSSLASGGASALPYMAAGGVPALVDAAPYIASKIGASSLGGLVSQGVAGAGGGFASELTGRLLSPSTPDWLRPALQTLAGIIGGGTAGAAAGVGGRLANVAAGKMNDAYNAFDRLGLDKDLVGTLSDDDLFRQLEASSSQAGLGSSILQPKMRRVVSQFGDAVDNTASNFGSQTNPDAAGKVLQGAAHNWITDVFPNQIEKDAWDPVHAAMTGKRVDPAPYRTALEGLVNPPDALPNASQPFLPEGPRQWLEGLNADIPPGGDMSWEQAARQRTSIGRAMGTPELVQSVGMDNLKTAYGGVAEAMRQAAEANGAGDAFANANATSTAGHNFIATTLRHIVSANNIDQETISPTSAVNHVLGTDDASLQALRDRIPDGLDPVAAYKMRQMATATPGQAGAEGDETSTGSFLTRYNQMRQQRPGGTDALFDTANRPDVAQNMSDLATAAAALRETARHINTSRTTPTGQLLSAAGLGVTGLLHGGLPEALTLAAAPFAGNTVTAALMGSPTVAKYFSAQKPELTSGLLSGGLGSDPGGQWPPRTAPYPQPPNN